MENNTTSETSNSVFTNNSLLYIGIVGFFAVVIFILNLLMFCVILYYKQLRENYSIVICSLCLSDALSGLTLIFTISIDVDYLTKHCSTERIIYFVATLSPSLVSQWQTVCLSLDRLIAVQFALRYHEIMTRTKLRCLVAAAWIVGSVETLIFSSLNNCSSASTGILIFLINILLTFVINGCIYAHLWRVARRQRRQIAQLQQQQQQQQQQPAVVDKATIMVIVIVVVYLMLWFPYLLSRFYSLISKVGSVRDNPFIIGYLNSIVNCIVYIVMNKNFKQTLKKEFLHCCCKVCPVKE